MTPQIDIQHGHSQFGSWERIAAAAHPALNAHVLGYVGLDSRMRLLRERHLPSGEAALVVNLGAPYRTLSPDGETHTHAMASVMGVHDRHFLTESSGSKRLIVVRLKPAALRILVGIDMHAATNRWIPLEQLDHGFARKIADATHDAPNWTALFGRMDRVLLAAFAAASPENNGAGWAWDELRRRNGLMNIASLSEMLGCSPRHLIAGFRKAVGVTPKTAARLMRFNRVLRHPVQGLGADIAAACGYADQSHMIGEFGRFAGAPPTEIARRVAGYTLIA